MIRAACLISLLAAPCLAAPSTAPAPAASTAPGSTPPAWRWNRAPSRWPAAALVASVEGAEVRLDPPKKGGAPLRLSHASRWAIELPPRVGDPRFEGAALAVDGARIYVARHNVIASGCALTAYSVEDGSVLWSVDLRGMGPVTHSRYHNRVQLAVVDGTPTVFGWETSGRYVERRAPDTGALTGHRFEPGGPGRVPW